MIAFDQMFDRDDQISGGGSEACRESPAKTHQVRLSLEGKGWQLWHFSSMALLVMLLLFLACWAPIHLLNIIEDFGVPVWCWSMTDGHDVHGNHDLFNIGEDLGVLIWWWFWPWALKLKQEIFKTRGGSLREILRVEGIIEGRKGGFPNTS